jgi:predicted nucleotidyltransferase
MSAIVWPRQQGNAVPKDFETSLARRLKGRVEAAYIFGSYGTPAFGPNSDVDLILVLATDLPFVERPSLVNDLYELSPRLDLLVYRPEEWERLQRETVGFWASVKTTLREVGSRSSSFQAGQGL